MLVFLKGDSHDSQGAFFVSRETPTDSLMDNIRVLDGRFNNCQNGSHKLIVAYRDQGTFYDTVVRWCEVCGAVVVDTDCDNRTQKGRMRGPSALYRTSQ